MYKQHLLNMGITETIGPEPLFGVCHLCQPAVAYPPTTTAPTKTYGINFTYGRDIRPDLSGYASLGYCELGERDHVDDRDAHQQHQSGNRLP